MKYFHFRQTNSGGGFVFSKSDVHHADGRIAWYCADGTLAEVQNEAL